MKTRFAATAALSLTAILALAGCSGAGGSGSMPGMDHGSGTTATQSPGADASEADVMFLTMMIPHHQQAVEMADVLLSKSGVDERVVALAEQIKAAQQPEIEQMEGWLRDWGVSMDGMAGMDHGGGMMSESDMQALEAAEGTEASRLFLQQMIEHHRGAVDMAQDEVDEGRNGDVVELARTIVDSQTAEIATMEELLATL
ncbi:MULTISPECIES: DUF305 domain-containing protein [Microbacterium]|jgi:uncharacterized protein (DUF305 family)|uniref:DUF305 domain-containing protein n=1 Tax=Microbacterium TaxID=33882 RepID=UPI001D173F31|nr:DUF305 domain-containing protein [Microbacterium testaceum]MCC4249788.1 DUF305 domain-containing protein [Microbacterium testaceum]